MATPLFYVKKAIDDLTNSLKKLDNQTAQKTNTAFDTIATGVKGFIGLQVVSTVAEWGKAFIDTASQVELLQSRIQLYSNTSVEATQIFQQLVTILLLIKHITTEMMLILIY